MKKYEKFKVFEAPQIPDMFDGIGRVIRFGYTPALKVSEEGEEVEMFVGYNIQISDNMDYGHVKSQIIEEVYPPKDEIALLNNAVSALLKERAGVTDSSIEEDIQAFKDFEEWRQIAGDAAKLLMKKFK
jgi:hypothetical protein